ncbi:Hypothetical_protein [Hexamita inflata]|uniref:Hypothetical_protein n=1 Tax=Hexamita inflata TaxID=28002 RepID=A0AA86NBK6_9EUKA|nr:Hypothetical protein HINF_LOCUS3935 [Hexamita inflata]
MQDYDVKYTQYCKKIACTPLLDVDDHVKNGLQVTYKDYTIKNKRAMQSPNYQYQLEANKINELWINLSEQGKRTQRNAASWDLVQKQYSSRTLIENMVYPVTRSSKRLDELHCLKEKVQMPVTQKSAFRNKMSPQIQLQLRFKGEWRK